MPVIDAQHLTDYIARIVRATGTSIEEAHLVAEHLVGANLRGHDSHGVIRVAAYVNSCLNSTLRPGRKHEVVRESASTALIDGRWNYGQVVATRAMDLAIEKARETGIGFVCCFNTGHIGRVGAYGEQAVAAGMIGWGGVDSPGGRLTAAFGGAHRRTGTSPIMFAMPTSDPDAPFVLDMATSVVAEGKLRVYANRGAQAPDGWIIDGDGNPTTEPRDFYGAADNPTPGALLPLGGPVSGYKGFGLNMAMEALSGILSGAGSAVSGVRGSNGVFLAAIDVSRFLPLQEFAEQFDALVEHVKEPPLAPGFDEIMVAGEPERRVRVVRLRDGIEIEDETWKQIANAAASVGVSVLTPPLPA